MTAGLQAPARVLVTGAAGGIGQVVVEALLDHGFAVTALSTAYQTRCRADRVIAGDATSVDDVHEAFADADAVVHLAAIPHPSLGTPYEVYRTNVNATFNVLSQAGERGISRAVIASSINAFGVPNNRHDVMPAYFPIDEDIPVDLDDGYSLSKRADELTSDMAWRHWGIDVVALRFPLVKPLAVLRQVARQVQDDPQRMLREGWAYLDVRDAAQAVLLGLTADVSGSNVIGLSAADTLQNRSSLELLECYAPDVPLKAAIVGSQSLIDDHRAREILGFTPQFSVHDSPTAESTSLAKEHDYA